MRLGWLPNALTIARCAFAVLVLVGIWQGLVSGQAVEQGMAADISADEASRRLTLQQLWYQFAFLSFLSGALTDFLDGWLARQLDAHSRFGVWLDPIADKLLVGAALIGLSLVFRSWLIYVPSAAIIARDVFMTWLRATPAGKAVVQPSGLAKWKTGFEMAAIIGLMFPLAVFRGDAGNGGAGPEPVLGIVGVTAVIGMLWLAAALSLLTAWQYMKAVRPAS